MTSARFVSATALAVALGWALPAQAQSSDAAAVQQELAEMRAQMRRMAERIDTLENQLATANAKADAASQAAASASLAATTATQAATTATQAAAKQPKVAWKGAPEFSTEGGFSFKPRGRMQVDLGAIAAPANLAGAERLGVSSRVRRFFLGADGTLPGGFGYRIESDFAGSAVALNDVYLTYKASKAVTLMAGYHRPFFGLEELTSDLFTSQMERASQSQAFNFERRLGLSAAYATDTVMAQAGVFTDDALSINDDTAHSWSVSGRFVAMPHIGDARLHLGVSANLRDLNGSTRAVRYRARPFLRTTDLRLVDTGALTATSERDLGAELAFISGRFHATAESHWLTARRPGRADPTFNAGYAELGYLLTDDETAYKGSLYERIKPKKPLGKGGIGAVQVNLRYDWLDLVDAGVLGGRQQVGALSLIWMPTEYVRFVANYGHIRVTGAPVTAGGDPDYSADAFGMRAQFDF